MMFSENNSNISEALAKSWGCIETPKHNSTVSVKTKQGGSYTFDYTDLAGIFEAVREVYKSNGISIMQNGYTEYNEKGALVCVETMLLHSSGEWVKSFPLKFPAANSMQDFGGQLTYMKRYSLASMLGIATEKDDDANGASGNSYTYQKNNDSSSKPSYTPPPSNIPVPQTAAEGAMIVSNFGKHKGKTLGVIFGEDLSYLTWMQNAEKTDEAIKVAIKLMKEAKGVA